MQGFLGKFRHIVSIVLGAVLAVFAIQNMAKVELTVLFWSFEARRIIVIAIAFVIGFAIGWLVNWRGRRRDAGPEPEPMPPRPD